MLTSILAAGFRPENDFDVDGARRMYCLEDVNLIYLLSGQIKFKETNKYFLSVITLTRIICDEECARRSEDAQGPLDSSTVPGASEPTAVLPPLPVFNSQYRCYQK